MKKKAVFIDLQGTLGGEGKGDIMDFTFFPYTFEALRLFNANNFITIIITNQAHISKGYFTYSDYETRAEELKNILSEKEVYIDGIYCCPHMSKDNCTCMKPLPGMVEKAILEFCIDRDQSYIIGDMGESDMLLAKNTGIKGIIVRTGGGEDSLTIDRHTWTETEPYHIADNILDAAKFLCS